MGYASTKNKLEKKEKLFPRHKKVSDKNSPNHTVKIQLYPCKELHQIWKKWLAAYRYYYNETLVLLEVLYDVEKEIKVNANLIDKLLQKLENIPEWVKTLPGHQRQEACDEAFDAFIKARKAKGKAKFKSCKATSQTIQFKLGDFKNGTWYSRLTKGLKFKSITEVPKFCNYGTELVYKRGKWFGCFPDYKEPCSTGSDKVIALDPGNRTFLTGFDGENVLEIGKGDIGKIQRLCLHLDNLISRSTKAMGRKRYKMRKAASRMRDKIQNLIKDLHNKSAALLVNSYKLIFLPTFDSSQMVVKINGAGKKRKINSKSTRQMLSLAHYRFEKHLKQAALKKGVIVALVNESYTSKTCSECGHIHTKLGGSKIFKCPKCGFKAPRDWVGALNIMIRALQATAFTFRSDAITINELVRNN